MILTYRYRIKDGANATKRALQNQASAVNFVWNFCVETDRIAADRYRAGRHVSRPSAFDLIKLCLGAAKVLGIHSDTVNAVCQTFTDARQAIFPKTPRFRSYKRHLPWIPVTRLIKAAKLDDGTLTFLKRKYRLWYSRPLPDGAKPKAWNIACDARGRWYVNIQAEVTEGEKRSGKSVGIDLGLKTLATLSDGSKIEPPQFYRKAEAQLAKFQRYGLKKRVTALTAKVANQRKDFLHKVTTRLVRDYAHIVVGNVSPSKLAKTRMAKSIQDAGWTTLRQQLLYKALKLGAVVEIVSERHSSQMCSCCGIIPVNSPKGMGALGIRHWVCPGCGSSHDRDVNAAVNILRVGLEHQPPVAEILAL